MIFLRDLLLGYHLGRCAEEWRDLIRPVSLSVFISVAAACSPVVRSYDSGLYPSVELGTISGANILVETNGDLYMPRFSPDGHALAFVKLIPLVKSAKPDDETRPSATVEVYSLDLRTGVRRLVLSADEAKQYAHYASSVTSMRWRDATNLELDIHDGDVGVTRLLIDVTSQRLLKAENIDYTMPASLSSEEQRVADAVLPVLPKAHEWLSSGGLRGVSVPDRGVLFQLRIHGEDSTVRFLDLNTRELRSFSKIPGWLMDGIAVNGSAILMTDVSVGPVEQWQLWWYFGGHVNLLVEGDSDASLWLEPRFRYSCGVILMVGNPLAFLSPRDNLLFFFNGKRVVRIADVTHLHDVDIGKAGEVVFSHWVEGRRRIVVRKWQPSQNLSKTDCDSSVLGLPVPITD